MEKVNRFENYWEVDSLGPGDGLDGRGERTGSYGGLQVPSLSGWMVVPCTEMEKSKEAAGLEREVREFNIGCSEIWAPMNHLSGEIK